MLKLWMPDRIGWSALVTTNLGYIFWFSRGEDYRLTCIVLFLGNLNYLILTRLYNAYKARKKRRHDCADGSNNSCTHSNEGEV